MLFCVSLLTELCPVSTGDMLKESAKHIRIGIGKHPIPEGSNVALVWVVRVLETPKQEIGHTQQGTTLAPQGLGQHVLKLQGCCSPGMHPTVLYGHKSFFQTERVKGPKWPVCPNP